MTLTNDSQETVPAGTTITWQFQNLTNSTQTISIANLSGVTVTPSSFTIAPNVTTTVTVTTSGPWLPGTSISWTYTNGNSGNGNWVLRSRLTLKYPATCASVSKCVSVSGSTFSTLCPLTPAPALVGRAATGPAPVELTGERTPPPGWTPPP